MDLAGQLQAQIAQLQQMQRALYPAPVAQQSPAAPELLLKLYDEFVNTDEGKQLAANLAKFARYAQSKVAKQDA